MKTKQINIRVSEDEHEMIKNASDDLEMNVSSYILFLIKHSNIDIILEFKEKSK